jgi:hypothetical protein
MSFISELGNEFSVYDDLISVRDFWADRQEHIYRESFRDIVKDDYRIEYGDAFRHSYVSAEFSFYFGDVIATMLGYATEASLRNNRDDYEMDLHNNMVGREIAREFGATDSEIEAGIWIGIIEGKFLVHDLDCEWLLKTA